MDDDQTTTAKLVRRYNTYTRRPVASNPADRAMMFGSLRRVLGPWLPEDREATILDIGCGEGNLLAFLRDAGYTRLDGFDLSEENVSICRQQGLDFVHRFNALEVGTLKDLPPFDVVFALDLLEHLPKESATSFLEQARDLLSPQGHLIVQTPNMGCIFGSFHRYNDLTHEYSLTEKSALDLFMVAGFAPRNVEIRPAWNATTALGRMREVYLRILHRLVYLAEDRQRPRIQTKNLLIRASRDANDR